MKIKRKTLFKTLGIIFLVIIFVLILADFKLYQKKQALISQINVYQKQIDEIKKNNQNLKNEIANSGSQDYLEKIAYEQFNEAKPGEKEVIFVQPQEKPKPASTPQNFWDSWLSDLSKVFNWIKSKF